MEVPMILSQQLLRGFKKNKGCIVNIASVTAQQSNPHGCAYGAVKAGLASFSRSLFDEARKYGVRVAVVSPDMTKTELYRNADFTVGRRRRAIFCRRMSRTRWRISWGREGVAVSEATLRPQYHRIRRKPVAKKGETGRMKDLTKGKPSTLILAFALPIFLGNLLQLTYSVTDTRIVGSFSRGRMRSPQSVQRRRSAISSSAFCSDWRTGLPSSRRSGSAQRISGA